MATHVLLLGGQSDCGGGEEKGKNATWGNAYDERKLAPPYPFALETRQTDILDDFGLLLFHQRPSKRNHRKNKLFPP